MMESYVPMRQYKVAFEKLEQELKEKEEQIKNNKMDF